MKNMKKDWIAPLLLLVVGCEVDQNEAVKTYREQVDLPPPATRPADAPISLAQVMHLANAQNEQLSIEGEAFYRAINQRKRAVAGFLPTVDLIPNYLLAEGGESNGGRDDNDRFSIEAGLNINLFNGMQDINSYWRDTFRIEQRRQSLLDAQQELLLDVVRAYYQVLVSEASVDILRQSLVTQEERLRDTQGRYDAGLARVLDVSQTQAQVSSTRISMLDAQRDARNARSLLTFLANTPLDTAALSDGFNPTFDIPPLEALLETAEEHRNDLRATAAAVDAARKEVDRAIGQYYPSVSLDLSAFLYDDLPSANDWQAILRANIPIFSAGRIEADVREAWSFFREAQLVHQRLRRQVRQEIEQAHNEVRASQKRLEELRVQLKASQDAYDQADKSYEAGLATNLDRLIAQSTLLNAQLSISSEDYLYKIRFLELRRAVGQLRQTLLSMPN